ncbi:MAG: hypothetical protein PVJ04_07745, partial [Gemmatimonadota bacterium]
MSKRLAPATMVALILAMGPHPASSQVSVSASLHMGLFDGFGVGMAASHWHHGSIFQPGFHLGLGASVGVGFGVGIGFQSYQQYYHDPYYYDGYGYGYEPYHGWSPYQWHASYSPFYCGWWGYPNSCWDWWDPYWYSGFHFSLGLGWNYYRRPAFFDPWWGYTGYLARWRPVWASNPGWWYYNDPWYVSPGYARVAYVVPAQRVVRVASPRGGYTSTTFKESPRRGVVADRTAKPRAGTATPTAEPRGGRVGVAQPGNDRNRAARPTVGTSGGQRVTRPGTASAG